MKMRPIARVINAITGGQLNGESKSSVEQIKMIKKSHFSIKKIPIKWMRSLGLGLIT